MAQKTALITGAARGIGFGIARQLAEDGYDLAVMDIMDKKEVQDKIQKLQEQSIQVLYFQGDLSKPEDRKKFCQKVVQNYKRIDVLVNNAGVAPRERNDVLEMTEESFDFVMDINLKGTFFLTQRVANLMLKQVKQDGETAGDDNSFKPRIINIASISSYTSSPSRGEYCISKAGVSMITKLFADRLAEEGINVYEIRPGIIYTDMTSGVKDKYDKLIAEGITPIQRWGQPEDIAKAVSAFCSGKFDFSTGEVINVDGGFHLRRL